jgi:D-amino-acid dehydrogenase
MPSRTVDVIVLGAGIVGVSAALALQARGRAVAIIYRLDEAAAETSFGNTGIVQSEAIFPYVFPRDLTEIALAAINRDPRAHIRHFALPSIAPALWRYFKASTVAGRSETARAMAALVGGASAEHRKLAEAAGAGALLRQTGWIKVWRSPRGEEAVHEEMAELKLYGIAPVLLGRAGLEALEPHLGAIGPRRRPFRRSHDDAGPAGADEKLRGALCTGGGRLEMGDARSLAQSGTGWTVATSSGPLGARDTVIALGPWSNDLAREHGLRLPFFVKRGYHMHYQARGGGLNRPVLDLEKGYVVTPMALGLRLTTGAEFARAHDKPSSAHLERLEPFAKDMFPLGPRKDAAPWLGRRPCLPDMRPIIGPFPGKPGLWLNFAHQHLGLTLGPISGRLLAEMMTGEPRFVDPAPFRAERFG